MQKLSSDGEPTHGRTKPVEVRVPPLQYRIASLWFTSFRVFSIPTLIYLNSKEIKK